MSQHDELAADMTALGVAAFNHLDPDKVLAALRRPKVATRHGDPRFYKLLEEIAELHGKKSYDYTPAGDPLANFKRSEKLGVPAWKGCLVRMGDKFVRIEQLASGKEPKNESLRDSLIDNAVYSLLAVLLLEDVK